MMAKETPRPPRKPILQHPRAIQAQELEKMAQGLRALAATAIDKNLCEIGLDYKTASGAPQGGASILEPLDLIDDAQAFERDAMKLKTLYK